MSSTNAASPAVSGAPVSGQALTLTQEAAARGMSRTSVWRERQKRKAEAAKAPQPTEKPRIRVKAVTAPSEPVVAEAATKPVAGGTLAHPSSRERRERRRGWVFATLQNNTFAHYDFIKTLENYCGIWGHELVVGTLSYNKDGWEQPHRTTKEDDSLWYDPAASRYIRNETIRIAPDLIWCGRIEVPLTASNPLSSLDSYAQTSSAIFPHPRVSMRSMPGTKAEGARFLFTTGACSQRNYIQRKTGQIAEFHHVFGALVVEVDEDGTWFARQLIANESGEFQDLDTVYTPHGARHERPEALIWGDIHRRHLKRDMVDACWGRGGILDALRPRYQVAHDVLHFLGRSHHATKDPFAMAAFMRDGDDKVEREISGDAEFLAAAERPWCETILPEANHHTHLRRWLAEADFRSDPCNARYGHYLAYRLHLAIEDGNDGFNVYEMAVREAAEKTGSRLTRTRWLACDESFEVAGVELGIHGDLGPNGSRGTPKAFRQLGTRSVTGHTHTAGIVDGVWTVGVTGSLDQGYNKGPSSWSHTHCLVFRSGKRQLITMRGTRWRGNNADGAIRAALAA